MPLVFINKSQPKQVQNVHLDSKAINLSCIKKAHKSNQLIVRLVETKGAKSRGRLRFVKPMDVAESNLIETESTPISTAVAGLDIELDPFEIKTLLLSPAI